jgi:hypothetical protein
MTVREKMEDVLYTLFIVALIAVVLLTSRY